MDSRQEGSGGGRRQPFSGTEQRRPISVVVVDADSMSRTMLSGVLAAAGLIVLADAGTGEAAVSVVVDLRPDVVLMGLNLPKLSGIDAIAQLGRLAPASRVLVLTQSAENRVVEAIVAGASGYILRTAAPEEIVGAVRATAAGESVLSPQIAGKLLQRIRERDIPLTAAGPDAAGAIRAALTERELEIFQRLANGESNQQIADQLSLSTNTISNHIASILAKLHLENRVQAAVHAVRSGIA